MSQHRQPSRRSPRLAAIRQATAEYTQAAEYLAAALELCRSVNDPSYEAVFLNDMGQVSLQSDATQQALSYHQQARQVAASAAAEYEQARALEGIGRCHLHNGQTDQAAAPLREALTIYHRLSSPASTQLERTLREHDLWPGHIPADTPRGHYA